MPIIKRIVISTGDVYKRGELHAPKFPDTAAINFRVEHTATRHVWWTPLAKLRSLSRGFEIVHAQRSPNLIDHYEIKVSGSGKPGKAAILVYVDTIIQTQDHGADHPLNTTTDLDLVHRNDTNARTITLPRARRRANGLEYVLQVNGATLTVAAQGADQIARILPDGTEEEGTSVNNANNGEFIALACRQKNLWTIIGETKDSSGNPNRWTGLQ